MFVANAVRGSSEKVGPGDGSKPKAPGRRREGEFGNFEFSVSKRRQLRPKEIVAGVGGEPNNLPLHSKYPAEKVWVLLGGEC